MRKYSRLAVVLLGMFLLAGILASEGSAAPQYRPDVIIVKVKPPVASALGRMKGTRTGIASLDALHARFQVVSFSRTVPSAEKPPLGSDRNGLTDYYTVELPPGVDVEVALAAYAADPNVEIAEPDYVMPMHATTPNDPMYGSQWTHYQTTDIDIDTPEAWDLETGDSNVIVGITDSGVLYDHEDLEASIWVNPGEDLDGDGKVWDAGDMNSVDDDGNGFIDDLIGWDFFGPQGSGCWPGEDCDGPDNNPDDFTGHGTHVGGIVAATTGNGLGVAGVAGGMRSAGRPGVKLMAIRVGYLADDGRGYVNMTACAAGFDYAVANGASVLNASWGTNGTLIQTAAQNALDAGLVVTKSAGNDNNEVPDALIAVPDVIVVAALNNVNKKASFSSYGTWVDISAPGDNILNTYGLFGTEDYASLGGTSMAAPTVAGVAALLKSHHMWFTHEEMDTLLLNYTDDVYADNPTYAGKLGSGRVDAFNCLSILTTADFDIDTGFGHTPWTVNFTDVSPNAPSGPYLYEFGDNSSAATANAMHTYVDPGVYTVSFTASGPSGPHTRTHPELIVAVEDTVQYQSILLPSANGSKAPVPIRLRNTHPMTDIYIPFRFTGSPNIFIDSLTLGSRIPGWSGDPVFDNRFAGQIVWRLSSGSAGSLPAGEGIIANVWVRSGAGNDPGEIETVDSARYFSHYLHLKSKWVDFIPDFVPGTITIYNPCGCPFQGDFDEDTFLTALDLSAMIDILFSGNPDVQDSSCPVPRADVDCDDFSTALDLSVLIDHLFISGPPPCDPCSL